MVSMQPYRQNQSNAANTPNYAQFLHMPYELNNLFLASYSSSWKSAFDDDFTLIYDADPFVIDSFIYCKKNNWMSDYSLPRLDA